MAELDITAKGEVERVGADTVTLQDGARYYPVTVRVDQQALKGRQANLPIIPGMISEVSIVTGSRTIIGYLLKPVLKLRERALQERRNLWKNVSLAGHPGSESSPLASY